MKGPYLLFPCSPLDGLKKVDEDFRQELEAALQVGFRTFFFDHDLLVREGKVEFNMLPPEEEILLRGWMLTLEQYTVLYAACGGKLINTPEQYESKHYWPKAYGRYEMLHANSPRCFWTDTKEFSVKHIKQFFGNKPIVVKDHVKSAKGAANAMFIKSSSDKNEVFTVINNMIKERGSLFQRGIVLKEYVHIDTDSKGNTIEFRAFYWNGKEMSVVSNGCEWDYLRAQMMPSQPPTDQRINGLATPRHSSRTDMRSGG